MSLLDVSSMPHECTIRRKIRTRGSLGGSRNTTATEQTAVPCWEQQASASEVLEFEKQGMSITSKIYFPTDPAVTERHEILITKRNGVAVISPIVLDVQSEALPDASAGLGVLFKIMVNQLTGAEQ